jgi:hypothetical protein
VFSYYGMRISRQWTQSSVCVFCFTYLQHIFLRNILARLSMLRNCTHFVVISCCLVHYILVSTLFSNKNEVTGCNEQVRNMRLQNHPGAECPGAAQNGARCRPYRRPASCRLAAAPISQLEVSGGPTTTQVSYTLRTLSSSPHFFALFLVQRKMRILREMFLAGGMLMRLIIYIIPYRCLYFLSVVNCL